MPEYRYKEVIIYQTPEEQAVFRDELKKMTEEEEGLPGYFMLRIFKKQ